MKKKPQDAMGTPITRKTGFFLQFFDKKQIMSLDKPVLIHLCGILAAMKTPPKLFPPEKQTVIV